jgi:5-(carboxyamino)imidazole ribonucleotide mutase
MAKIKKKAPLTNKNKPLVGIIMGSQSDWPVMQAAHQLLTDFGIAHETRIISAHRTPKRLVEYAESAAQNGLEVIIAGAGGAAHLPGMVAALTHVPVLGVPVAATALNGIDALYSIVQMPKGVPVASFAIGEHGAMNAALFAVSILAGNDAAIRKKLLQFRAKQTASVPDKPKPTLSKTTRAKGRK